MRGNPSPLFNFPYNSPRSCLQAFGEPIPCAARPLELGSQPSLENCQWIHFQVNLISCYCPLKVSIFQVGAVPVRSIRVGRNCSYFPSKLLTCSRSTRSTWSEFTKLQYVSTTSDFRRFKKNGNFVWWTEKMKSLFILDFSIPICLSVRKVPFTYEVGCSMSSYFCHAFRGSFLSTC